MKTERRHELQKNELADHLGKYIQAIQPYLGWIGIAIVGVLVVLLVGSVLSRRSASSTAAAWEEYLQASSATDPRKSLEDIAVIHEDSPAGLWAEHTKANMDLEQGAMLVYQNSEESKRLLQDAVAGFQNVVDRAERQPMLRQHARYGLAVAYETLGELKKARQAYDEIVKSGDDSALAELAKKRLDRLKNEDVREFYDWFVSQEITPPSGPPGASGLPSDLQSLPDFPDLGLPPAMPPGEPLPGSPTADPGTTVTPPPADDAPAEGDATAAEDAATEEPAAEDAPAADDAEAATDEEAPADDESAAPAEPAADEEAAPSADEGTSSPAQP